MADEEGKIPEAHIELAKEQDLPSNVEEVAPDPPEAPAESKEEDDKPEDREEQSSLAEPPRVEEENKTEDEPKEQDTPSTGEQVAPDPVEAPAMRKEEDDKPEDQTEQSSLAEPPRATEENKKEQDERKEQESKQDESKEDESKEDEPKTDEKDIAQVQPSEPQQPENEQPVATTTETQPQAEQPVPVLAAVSEPQVNAEAEEDDVFVPDDCDAESILNFGAVLYSADSINEKQMAYFTKIAERMTALEQHLMGCGMKFNAIMSIIHDPRVPNPMASAGGNESQASQSPNEQMAQLLQQLKAMQTEENKEEPKSFLHKKGDEDQMKDYEERQEEAKKTQITPVAKATSDAQLTREQMEEQRRARYAAMQNTNRAEVERQKESVRKSEQMNAFWKNEGTKNPHAK